MVFLIYTFPISNTVCSTFWVPKIIHSIFQVTVRNHYRENPFHNFRHCFCVTQMMYVFIHQCKLKDKFSHPELAALITACICHDLDHPGLNNT